MAIYRISRNIETSFIDFLQEELESIWTNINIVKGFSKAYDLTLPVIAVRAQNTVYNKVEVGSNSFTRTVQVFINLFCENDGQRLDLKDSIIEILKDGLTYYEYTIMKQGRTSIIEEKEANGRINIIKIDDTQLYPDVEKDKEDVNDRYRHLITLSVTIGKVE
jgi:hypothetical protein